MAGMSSGQAKIPAGRVIGFRRLQGPAEELAPWLLGQSLCRRLPEGVVRHALTEIEIYDGSEDRASHAFRGRTPRNSVMFEAGGRWYVYLCYGVHWLLNLVTGPADHPTALLLRGTSAVSGPGRLTRALDIGASLNRASAPRRSGLWLEENPQRPVDVPYRKTPRIGIGKAGDPWVDAPLRFVVDECPSFGGTECQEDRRVGNDLFV